MNKNEISLVLSKCLPLENRRLDTPSPEDWVNVENYFKTKLPQEYKYFVDLMTDFSFPGDIYNPTSKILTNGNDDIILVYETEIKNSNLSKNLIPFYGIGNGDYFCLSIEDGEKSAVYCTDHSTGEVSKEADSFEDWIIEIPNFLNG
ncbi:SMI1/KNR4 family protein [Iodobacter fluviatilis]|uniref:SMI1 / KNR4 family n=1 Tax=Iodobacter fluviatilis TaxID=537 RepID=A0A377Q3J2_9NEIS|nr:SMI1/KNR4 family protein [Iodobacter fluviatilis]TCU82648.1 SUKH superfamily protein [Iodobacter fluviatilis]STQ89866.1 SMI1 / KNR4 family [Iodobacter fluviatilis]